jgi:hypothetical protein
MVEPRDIVSYAHRDLSRKQVVKLARQYEGVDMAELMGADDENFPFVIEDGFGAVYFWNVHHGIMAWIDEDPVRNHAMIQFLREHAYPTFKTIQDADQYAKEHDWPRKSR